MGVIGRILAASMTMAELPPNEWYAHIKRAIDTPEVEHGDENPPE